MERVMLWLAAGLPALIAALPSAAVAASGGQPSAGGMPQLDFANPLTIAQVVWLLIIFGLLYVVLAGPALPRVGAVLANRRARIDGDLDAAQSAKAAADTAMAAHRDAMAKARAEAQAAIAAATNAAQAEAASRAVVANAALDRRIAEAEARIAASRDQAMRALPQVAADTTEALVARLAGSADRAMVEREVARQLELRKAA